MDCEEILNCGGFKMMKEFCSIWKIFIAFSTSFQNKFIVWNWSLTECKDVLLRYRNSVMSFWTTGTFLSLNFKKSEPEVTNLKDAKNILKFYRKSFSVSNCYLFDEKTWSHHLSISFKYFVWNSQIISSVRKFFLIQHLKKCHFKESSLCSEMIKFDAILTSNSISLQATELVQKRMLKLNSLFSPSVSKMFLKDEIQTFQSVATFLIKQPRYFISFCNRSKKEIFLFRYSIPFSSFIIPLRAFLFLSIYIYCIFAIEI